MGAIVRTARAIMATLQPLTGERATGSVLVTASGEDVTIPRNRYALPVVEGQQRPELAMKVGEGPNSDKSWTATSSGTTVSMLSNIGGRRQCIESGVVLAFDPPLDGVKSVVASTPFLGGTNLTTYGALRDLVFFENLTASRQLDLARSGLAGFPGALLTWVDDIPVDGSSTDSTSRRDRMGTRKALSQMGFQLAIISERSESAHSRRAEGLEVLDQIAGLLVDRQNIDGQPFSNPSGLRIIRRWRETLGGPAYQRLYVYGLQVSAMVTLGRTDTRSYNPWNTSVIDAYKRDEGETDLPLVTEVEVEMNP